MKTPDAETATALAQHSELPFKCVLSTIWDNQERLIAQVCCSQDAHYITEAVNQHAAMVNALEILAGRARVEGRTMDAYIAERAIAKHAP